MAQPLHQVTPSRTITYIGGSDTTKAGGGQEYEPQKEGPTSATRAHKDAQGTPKDPPGPKGSPRTPTQGMLEDPPGNHQDTKGAPRKQPDVPARWWT